MKKLLLLALIAVVGCSAEQIEPTATPTTPPAEIEPILPIPREVKSYAIPPEISPAPEPPELSKPKPESKPEPKPPTTISLWPTTAFLDQSVLDDGKLVTWFIYHDKTCVIAGHDVDGWHWLDNIAERVTVVIESGPCSGSYVITGHHWVEDRGAKPPELLFNYDLVLQTCTQPNGSGFSLAQKK
jgi:hypothetical protein